jgi:hypothetical protein
MFRFKSRRPSPALVISLLALIVAALGGGQAFAAAGARISALINGKSIKKNSIPADRIRKNSLTGTQINEAKLAKVPLAGRADQADHAAAADKATSADAAKSVNGSSVKTFSFKSTTGGGSQVIGTFAGYTLTASCNGSLNPQLEVKNDGASTGEFITNKINQSGVASTYTQFTFTAGSTAQAITDTHGTANFNASRADGGVLTGQVFYDNNPAYGGTFAGCAVAGSVVYSG